MQQEDLPFIRAIRHVPQEMVERLPAEYHLSLDTIRIFGADDLQLAVYRCARMFNVSFGMVVPPVNHNLFLLQYVRSLALPLEVYATARRLNTIASYTFSYPDSTSPSTETSARRHPTTYPEAQLMSLVVIATKLLFPFDSETIKRHPKDPNDPTTMRLDWSAWLDAKTHFDNDHKDDDASASPPDLKPGSEIEVTDDQILKMTDRQLDRYMDWYQRTWISTPASSDQQTQTDTSLDKAILDMFPLRDVAVPTKSREQHEHDMQQNQKRLTSRIQRVQASLLPRKAISQEEEDGKQIDILRPGAYYPRFRDVQDLDRAGVPVVRAFHEEAARAACLGLPPLLRAVNHSEEKVDRWLKDQRRREVFGDEDEDEDQDDDEENVGEMIAKNNDIAHQQGPESDLLATSPPTASAGLLARDIGELALLSESPQPPQDAQEDSSQLQDDDEDVEMQMHSEP
jgi:RNA polymerase I-specific transcription initiation factor RRN7